jgi:hypothetical protein
MIAAARISIAQERWDLADYARLAEYWLTM